MSADPIDRSLLALVSLFETGPLQGIRFPDVDAANLSQLADGVRRAADDVTQAQAMLSAARSALASKQQELLAQGHRALAYARVYAATSPDLRAELDRIALPRLAGKVSGGTGAAADPSAPRRPRGRPRKNPQEPVAAAPRDVQPIAAE